MFALCGQRLDGCIGEGFPTFALVAAGLASLYGERSVEEEDALIGPTSQIATIRKRGGARRLRKGRAVSSWLAVFVVELLVDVLERWWWLDTLLHAETQAMRLIRTMVRILSEDDHLDFVKRRAIEGLEDLLARRIAYARLVCIPDKLGQDLEIRAVKLWLQHLLPGRFYLYVHFVALFMTAKVRSFYQKTKN